MRVGLDREEAACVFVRQDLAAAPAVGGAGRLVGVIMVDDVVDVIREEAEENDVNPGGAQGGDLRRGDRRRRGMAPVVTRGRGR